MAHSVTSGSTNERGSVMTAHGALLGGETGNQLRSKEK